MENDTFSFLIFGGHVLLLHLRQLSGLSGQYPALHPAFVRINFNSPANTFTFRGSYKHIPVHLQPKEKGLDLLKSNNIDGISSDMIGTYLAIYLNRPEEAVPYLSEAFLDHFSALLNIAASYAFVFYSRKDWKAALDILQWAIASLKGLTTEDGSGSFLKIHIYLLALLASIQAKLSQEEASQKSLAEAAALARQFDSQPDYRVGGIRFIDPLEQSFSYDILGTSAEESVSTLFRFLKDPVFSEKWKEAMSHEF